MNKMSIGNYIHIRELIQRGKYSVFKKLIKWQFALQSNSTNCHFYITCDPCDIYLPCVAFPQNKLTQVTVFILAYSDVTYDQP